MALATVADRLARGIDTAGQGGLRHDPAAPHRGDEIVLGDDAIAVLNEANQQIEHLRLDGDGFGAAMQLAPVGVEQVIGKDKLHAAAPNILPNHSSLKNDLVVAKRDFRTFRICLCRLRTGR